MNDMKMYYLAQARGYQKGGDPIPSIFIGKKFQRGRGFCYVQNGRGIGSFLSSIYRFVKPIALPFLQKTGREIGQQAIKAGLELGNELIRGNLNKASAKERLKTLGKDIGLTALSNIRGQFGARGLKRKKVYKGVSNGKRVRRDLDAVKRGNLQHCFGVKKR
jgi:hypothetical protein